MGASGVANIWGGLGLVMGWAGLMRDERHVSWA
nr:MAG TPA: hypothetical protein [Caudoviricetes sp.]